MARIKNRRSSANAATPKSFKRGRKGQRRSTLGSDIPKTGKKQVATEE